MAPELSFEKLDEYASIGLKFIFASLGASLVTSPLYLLGEAAVTALGSGTTPFIISLLLAILLLVVQLSVIGYFYVWMRS